MEAQKNYTVGTWIAKAGKEYEFIREWTKFARWTSSNIEGGDKEYLLQDEKILCVSFLSAHGQTLQRYNDGETAMSLKIL